MKYLKRFETNSRFNVGDYVKCVMGTNKLKSGKIYKVSGISGIQYIDIFIGNNTESYFSRRFVLATPDEIEQYKLEQNSNKYNL